MYVWAHRVVSEIDADFLDEDSIIAGLQAFDAWHEDLGNPSPAQIGALNACPSISGLVVGPIIAYIDEHYGRRWGIRCKSASLCVMNRPS